MSMPIPSATAAMPYSPSSMTFWTFPRLRRAGWRLEYQPFDLRNCVAEALDLLAPQVAEKGLELAYCIDEHTPCMLVSDVTRLRQILVNLLSNAVKFTEVGEVVVLVHASHLAPNRYELHFAVQDTGIGIPPDRMDRLFRSFSQVDASTTRRYGGTGLGLAISKQLVEMLGGTIWVESVVGQGSTFHFTIVAEATPSQPHIYPRGTLPQLAGKRVLIVDDSATNRRMLTLQVQAWGMLPWATGSGPEALVWLRSGNPCDIALLDMQMPEMDGLTLAAEMRKYREAQILPLVMLTSIGRGEAKAQPGQFAAFLTKPIKASALYDVLEDIFARQVRWCHACWTATARLPDGGTATAADPPGGGQCGEPEGGAADAGAHGLPCRRGRQWAGSARGLGTAVLRCDIDGCAYARDGWPGSDATHLPAVAYGTPTADHCDDGQCHARGSGSVPGDRHG